MSDDTQVTLEQRAKGKFPISIGTSLALEGLFGMHDDIVKPANDTLIKWDCLWVNVRTLYRNLVGSMPMTQQASFTAVDYAVALAAELAVIEATVRDKSNGRIATTFYYNSYKSLPIKFPGAQVKLPTTSKQQVYAALENSVLQLTANTLVAIGTHLHVGDLSLRLPAKNVLLITHFSLDALLSIGYTDVALLESRTGVIKPKGLWYTKLNGGSQLQRIPFDVMTIQVFGDSGGTFMPYPSAVRRRLVEVANKHSWTSTVTKDRVLLCLSLEPDRELFNIATKLYQC